MDKCCACPRKYEQKAGVIKFSLNLSCYAKQIMSIRKNSRVKTLYCGQLTKVLTDD